MSDPVLASAPATDPLRHSLRFGPEGRFELQPAERRLLVDGQPTPLGGRALDLLLALAARPDHLMSKSELLDQVWPGLVVEEANLQVQISNLRKLLGGDVIATVPGRGYRFAAAVQAGGLAAAAVAAATPLPVVVAATPRLFGRDADLQRLQQQLHGGACVSLVGPSGVGKTSLARAAAAAWAGRNAWVDLAALSDGAQIPAALARALGVPLAAGQPTAQWLAGLNGPEFGAGGPLLLVLDNAEHLVQAVAELIVPLQAVAGLQPLVTSQLPLAVAGEKVQRLAPLHFSDADAPAAAADLLDGALAMLVERITAADHRFVATPAALPLLAAICAQLDGLPLALEMAAARVPVLGLQAVHDALTQRFALLRRGRRDAAERHRSLHQALDWSYRLLSAEEQRLFRALGVFAGGFTLDLAVALLSDDPADRWDLIDGLATLVDRSLVSVSRSDPPRYQLLETLRAFALDELERDGELRSLRERHATALLALLRQHGSSDGAPALCLAEAQNVRDAIAWARPHALATASELSALLVSVAGFSVWRHEAETWLLALQPQMESESGQALPAEAQARWWTQAARSLGVRGHRDASAAARRALTLWEPLQDPQRSLFANVVWVRSISEPGAELDEACARLQQRAQTMPALTPRERLLISGALMSAANLRGDIAAAAEECLVEIALAREAGFAQELNAAESNLVMFLNALGRHAEAVQHAEALQQRVGRDNGNLPWVLIGHIEALVGLRRLDEAQALVPGAVAAGRRFGTTALLPTLAWLAQERGRNEVAALLAGHAEQPKQAVHGNGNERLKQTLEAAQAALGDTRLTTLRQRGARLGDDDAAALATGDEALLATLLDRP